MTWDENHKYTHTYTNAIHTCIHNFPMSISRAVADNSRRCVGSSRPIIGLWPFLDSIDAPLIGGGSYRTAVWLVVMVYIMTSSSANVHPVVHSVFSCRSVRIGISRVLSVRWPCCAAVCDQFVCVCFIIILVARRLGVRGYGDILVVVQLMEVPPRSQPNRS